MPDDRRDYFTHRKQLNFGGDLNSFTRLIMQGVVTES